MKWFGRKSEIRSFGEDTAGMRGMGVASRGIQAIPVEQIVGSVGRAHELRPNFMPILRPHGDDRFNAIRARMERGESLPPIEVYKLHDRYYVLDGNHRVAAARKVGLAAVDAVVTEYRPSGMLAAA
jgi:hypothetical protein